MLNGLDCNRYYPLLLTQQFRQCEAGPTNPLETLLISTVPLGYSVLDEQPVVGLFGMIAYSSSSPGTAYRGYRCGFLKKPQVPRWQSCPVGHAEAPVFPQKCCHYLLCWNPPPIHDMARGQG